MRTTRLQSRRALRLLGAIAALAVAASGSAADPTQASGNGLPLLKQAQGALSAAAKIEPTGGPGIPQDWSHRQVIYANPDSQEEAAAKGTLQQWKSQAEDPRFVLQLEKKYARQAAAAVAAAAEQEAWEAQQEAERAAAKPKKPKKPKDAPGPVVAASVHRDWSNVMGGASGVGVSRLWPAKFAFGVTTKDCANDYVVYVTAAAGAAGTSGTLASRTGTFTNQPTAGQTATIGSTSHGTSIVLTASATVNTGLSFQLGATTTDTATNLANAINRNGGTVGATASSSTNVVTVTAGTWGATAGTDITLAKTLGNFTWAGASLTGGTGTAAQPTIFALNNLYADCSTTAQGYPQVLWSYNTGTGATADISPALSINGDQVAFVQRTASAASLVLLKWSSSSPGTLGVPTTPATVTQANYRSCTAPCMTLIAFSGNPNDSISAPFVDYANDLIYAGDDAGVLHKFTGVFNGTPAEQTTGGWPATVSAGNILSSPVLDLGSSNVGGGLVYVGSNGISGSNGNRLHSVSASGTVVSSGAIGGVSSVNGVRAPPIVDSNAQRVYVFLGSSSSAADMNGVTCVKNSCTAVYQFSTASSIATQNSGMGTKIAIGESEGKNDITRALSAGDFDEKYYSSADATNPSGSLYVCGSSSSAALTPTVWRISIVNNAIASSTEGPQLVTSGKTADDGCSPVTLFQNGGIEYLFVSVTNDAGAAGGSGCTTPSTGCMYMYQLASGATFDTTSTSSTINDNNVRYFSVSTSAALSTTEATVATTLTAAQAGTFAGMTITQSGASGPGNTFTYTLRKNGANTAVTCAITGTTCSDTMNTATYAAGDTMDVQVQRTSGGGNLTNRTFRFQTTGLNSASSASAALNAKGGTGGIIIDNTASSGGSQIYYSTRTSPGNAVQASQAGLN